MSTDLQKLALKVVAPYAAVARIEVAAAARGVPTPAGHPTMIAEAQALTRSARVALQAEEVRRNFRVRYR